ncbi:MAG: HAD family hydrolase [Dehalococcoidia bacterium]|nr:HAD family hydrolase [Dehalococcoidia bacterium]
MRIGAAFFDFDLTLGHMSPSHFAVYVQAAREHGLDVSEETLRARPLDDAWNRWMTPLGVVHLAESASEATIREVRIAIAVDRLNAALDEQRAASEATAIRSAGERIADLEGESRFYRLYDDALPCLRRLSEAGVRCVIVSNHVWRLPEIVDDLGAGAYLAGTITSARVGARKPHPSIFEAALAVSGVPPEATVMVGDSVSADVRGAERLGMHALLLDRGGKATPSADVRVIRSLDEMPLDWPPPQPSGAAS